MESKINKLQISDRVTEVWAMNQEYEMSRINNKLRVYPMIGIDTEFPGFLRNRPISDPENLRYDDLVFNVNSLKLIQLGVTLFNDKGEIGGCWQINFSGFDVDSDAHVPESIQLLERSGVDLEKIRFDGVDKDTFAENFNTILSQHRERIRWITFHGIYDVAYLSKLLTKKDIPSSKFEFVDMVNNAIGGAFYDVKLMDGRGGLQKVAEELFVERVGRAHQAGHDSLLTVKVFLKVSQGVNYYYLINFVGYLYGFSPKFGCRIVGQSVSNRIQGYDMNPLVPKEPYFHTHIHGYYPGPSHTHWCS